VLPVLRIQARYYGWKMALYILVVFLIILVATALLLHYAFAGFGQLPDSAAAQGVTDRDFFALDYTFGLNLLFLAVSALFFVWHVKVAGVPAGSGDRLSDRILFVLAWIAFAWLALGITLPLYTGLPG